MSDILFQAPFGTKKHFWEGNKKIIYLQINKQLSFKMSTTFLVFHLLIPGFDEEFSKNKYIYTYGIGAIEGWKRERFYRYSVFAEKDFHRMSTCSRKKL